MDLNFKSFLMSSNIISMLCAAQLLQNKIDWVTLIISFTCMFDAWLPKITCITQFSPTTLMQLPVYSPVCTLSKSSIELLIKHVPLAMHTKFMILLCYVSAHPSARECYVHTLPIQVYVVVNYHQSSHTLATKETHVADTGLTLITRPIVANDFAHKIELGKRMYGLRS